MIGVFLFIVCACRFTALRFNFFRLPLAFLRYEPDHTVIPLFSVLFNQLRTRLNNLDSRHSIGINVIQVREIDQFPINHHQWTRTVLRANGEPKSRIFDSPKPRPDLIRTSIYKCATDAFELSFLRLFRRDLDHPFRSLLAIMFDRLLSFQYRHRVDSGGIQLRKAIGRNFLAIQYY